MSQGKNWCFTDQIPKGELPSKPAIAAEGVKYLIAQKEVAPTTGQLHWQGFVSFKTNKRLKAVKKMLPRAHWELAKGSASQNKVYCTKEASRAPGTAPVEFGDIPNPGKRTDLEEFATAVRSGKRARHLADEGFLALLARYPKLYAALAMTHRPPTHPDKKVILLFGKPGAGKTRFVFDKHEKDPEFWTAPLSNGTPWFDGFDGHETALLDDFDGKASKVGLAMTLKLFDIYPIQAPTKGGHAWWNPKTLYVTTNLPPQDWYDFSTRRAQYDALLRRVTEAHCWDLETGFYTHCKTNSEVVTYFPYKERAPLEDPRYPLSNSLYLKEK